MVRQLVTSVPSVRRLIHQPNLTTIQAYLKKEGLVKTISCLHSQSRQIKRDQHCEQLREVCQLDSIGAINIQAQIFYAGQSLMTLTIDQYINALKNVNLGARNLALDLQLQLRVWYCKSNHNWLASQRLHSLRTFLQQNGTQLSTNQKLLPYFALQYVQDVSQHPILKAIFQPEWDLTLLGLLEEWLAPENPPEQQEWLAIVQDLIGICQQLYTRAETSWDGLDESVQRVKLYAETIGIQWKDRPNQPDQEYQQVSASSRNRNISAMERQSDPVSAKRQLSQGNYKHQSSLDIPQQYKPINSLQRTPLQPQSIIPYKLSTKPIQQIRNNSIFTRDTFKSSQCSTPAWLQRSDITFEKILVGLSLGKLDYDLVWHLINANITKNNSKQHNLKIIQAFVNVDILEGTLNPKYIGIQEIKFIAKLSVAKQGRHYIVSKKPTIINQLISLLQTILKDLTFPLDNPSHSQLLVQLLSFSKKMFICKPFQQALLANKGAIFAILKVLSGFDGRHHSDYNHIVPLYAMALLMSLAVHNQGIKLLTNETSILTVIIQLLRRLDPKYNNSQMESYGYAIVYSLFNDHRIILLAEKDYHYKAQLLNRMLGRTERPFIKMVQHIIQRMEGYQKTSKSNNRLVILGKQLSQSHDDQDDFQSLDGPKLHYWSVVQPPYEFKRLLVSGIGHNSLQNLMDKLVNQYIDAPKPDRIYQPHRYVTQQKTAQREVDREIRKS